MPGGRVVPAGGAHRGGETKYQRTVYNTAYSCLARHKSACLQLVPHPQVSTVTAVQQSKQHGGIFIFESDTFQTKHEAT